MIESLEEVKDIMERYYLDKIRDNDELISLCKNYFHKENMEKLLLIAIKQRISRP